MPANELINEVMPDYWSHIQPLAGLSNGVLHDRIASAAIGILENPNGKQPVESRAAVAALPLLIAQSGEGGIANFDIDSIGSTIAGKNHAFDAEWSQFQRGVRSNNLMSQAGDTNFVAMHKAMYTDMMNVCLQSLVMEPCPQVMSDPILSCLGVLRVGCKDDGRWRVGPYLGQVKFGKCKPADSHRDFYGLGNPFYGKHGGLCWDKVGFATKTDTRCGNVGEMLLRIAEQQLRPQWIDHQAEYAVRYMLGGGCCDDGLTCGKDYRPWFMGCRYKTYSLPGEGDFVINKLCLNKDLTHCTADALLCAVEELEENRGNCHPFTGRMVRCCTNRDVIVFGKGCSARLMRESLGAQELTFEECAEGKECAETRRFPRASRPGYGNVKSHPYFGRFAFDYFKECYGTGTALGLTDDQIQQMVDRTYIIGCTQQLFKRLIPEEGDYIRRSWNGEGTWPRFDQDIDRATGVDLGLGFAQMVLERGAVTFIQGLPDGFTSCDQLCA